MRFFIYFLLQLILCLFGGLFVLWGLSVPLLAIQGHEIPVWKDVLIAIVSLLSCAIGVAAVLAAVRIRMAPPWARWYSAAFSALLLALGIWMFNSPLPYEPGWELIAGTMFGVPGLVGLLSTVLVLRNPGVGESYYD